MQRDAQAQSQTKINIKVIYRQPDKQTPCWTCFDTAAGIVTVPDPAVFLFVPLSPPLKLLFSPKLLLLLPHRLIVPHQEDASCQHNLPATHQEHTHIHISSPLTTGGFVDAYWCVCVRE